MNKPKHINKNILTQYADMQEEIKDLEERIKKIKEQSEIVHDVVQNGYKRNLVIIGVDVKRVHKLDNYKSKLQVFYDKLLDIQNECEEFIENIEDSKMRSIFRYRYIDGFKWAKISIILEEDEEVLRKRHTRFLDKFIKN